MSKQDLKDKYGRNKKTRQLLNAAIRAEQPFGDDVLNLLQKVHDQTVLGNPPPDLVTVVEEFVRHLVAMRNVLEDRVRADYDFLPPVDADDQNW